jgi:xanthine dehydrogenase accessory factor
VSLSDISKIRGPIGLIPSMRDTNLLALSTLAEIIKVAKDKNLL